MFLTKKIERAIVLSTVLHSNQKRKISGVPYIIHPYSVAFLLAHYIDDEDVIIAGLLHDTLEDVPTFTEKMLEEEFGSRVCAIVKEVTENYTQEEKENPKMRPASWQYRKEGYLKGLKDDSTEALLIASADKIHNMRSFLDEYPLHFETIWESFHTDKEKILWFYSEATRIIKERLDHPLALELQKVFEEFETTLRKS
ncbi:MAG: HD domain-containing protein [Candidatus Moranbacteria bacterium]|nr:HD domain-containing protein [Candidatus Moranbacteria bacterium]MDD3965114.1 HD domain-containing protein [Candidatus Moranbacteria bacterium]